MVLEAALSDAQVEQVLNLLDGATVETAANCSGWGQIVRRRGHDEQVDRHVRVSWRSPDDEQQVYGRALNAVVEDFAVSTYDRRHRPTVDAADGLAALELALDARRLAGRTNP